MSRAQEMTAEQLIDLFLEEPTKGMKNAYAKRLEARYKCTECGALIPKYEGRYPSRCVDCQGELEDLQNAPVYSEAEYWKYNRGKKESDRDRRKMGRQMRAVPQDRIGGESVDEIKRMSRRGSKPDPLLDIKKQQIKSNPTRLGIDLKGKYYRFDLSGSDIVEPITGLVVYDSRRDWWDDDTVIRAYRFA